MKVLKLDSRFEDARRVARCVVGSIADESWHKEITECPKLSYICDNYFVVLFWDVTGIDFDTKHTITLPINTLELCPFLATKHNVSVMAISHDGKITRGMITNIDDCETCQIGWDYISTHFLHEISLDLKPIERGELEGCEIVEI